MTMIAAHRTDRREAGLVMTMDAAKSATPDRMIGGCRIAIAAYRCRPAMMTMIIAVHQADREPRPMMMTSPVMKTVASPDRLPQAAVLAGMTMITMAAPRTTRRAADQAITTDAAKSAT